MLSPKHIRLPTKIPLLSMDLHRYSVREYSSEYESTFGKRRPDEGNTLGRHVFRKTRYAYDILNVLTT